jgi:hypothetical protein
MVDHYLIASVDCDVLKCVAIYVYVLTICRYHYVNVLACVIIDYDDVSCNAFNYDVLD